jgi:hypothetical protein
MVTRGNSGHSTLGENKLSGWALKATTQNGKLVCHNSHAYRPPPILRTLQTRETPGDELYLRLDTKPIRSANDILLFYACLHVEHLMHILRKLVAQLSVMLK